jgi:hypothetical protein
MSNPGMWLEIRKGKTNFPLRPISGERFLIGAGSHCHLQLGGDHVPMLHSLLVIEGQTAHLEAVMVEPPLLVNGEACRMVELQDEDMVSIGDFEFVFHRLVSAEPVSQASPSELPDLAEVSQVTDLSRLSALELVNLIEEEALQITAFNRSRELGAVALIDAALRSGAHPRPISVPWSANRPQAAPLPRAEQWRLQYEELLERQSKLKNAQAQLETDLAEFAKQMAILPMSETQSPLRASA